MTSKSKRPGDKKPKKPKYDSSSEDYQNCRKSKRKHSESKSKSSRTYKPSDYNRPLHQSSESTGNGSRFSNNFSNQPFTESSTTYGGDDSFRDDLSSGSWDTEPNGKETTPDLELQVNHENINSQIEALAANADTPALLKAQICRNEELQLIISPSLYPAWRTTNKVKPPISTEEIASIFKRITRIFGFQKDNAKNMFDHLMVLLDSRASRMGMNRALASLHADYIGGENANYRKWYFAAQIDLYDYTQNNSRPKQTKRKPDGSKKYDGCLEAAMEQWKNRMTSMSTKDRISQVILYLLCWGEANQVRFMPECLAFIFMCANEYYFHGLQTLQPIDTPTSNPNNNYDDISIDQQGTTPVNIDSTSDGKWNEYDEFHYLDNVITPFYEILRNQVYEKVNGQNIRKEKDHSKVIGYDDINQLFWHREGLERLTLESGRKLVTLPLHDWYPNLGQVKWDKAFYKTYCETRSWFHMMINFNRIWIIHVSMFWFYTAFNSPTLYTVNYDYTKDNQPPSHVRWSIVAMGAAIGPLVNIIATFSEYMFVPRKFPGAQNLLLRLIILLIALALIVAPTCYILLKRPLNSPDTIGISIAIVQMAVAIIFTIFFSITPLGNLFGLISRSDRGRKNLGTKYFVASFYHLRGNDRLISYGLWVCILVAKLTESYFFLTLSLRDPIRELSILNLSNCLGDIYFGPHLCKQQARLIMFGMFVTDLVLFFLDSYLWYIIFNTLFSVARSFYLGVSIWTPWRNIYSRLPKRIYSKILCTQNIPSNKYRSKKLVSEIWNIIIRTMHSQHLIPVEQRDKLLFKSEVSPKSGEAEVVEPTFFVSQEDQAFHSSIFEAQSEAERRISFFAQSLATPIPETYPIEKMPSFTVLIPHYREKIMLAIREVIRGDDQNAKISLLEYLKQLHPLEWNCFVEDTKNMVDANPLPGDDEKKRNVILSEIPFYCIGFKSSEQLYIDRTRKWASRRAQTLYRTISGFMNYAQAIKLLYMVENRRNLTVTASGNHPSSSSSSSSVTQKQSESDHKSSTKVEKDEWLIQDKLVNKVINRKFRLLVSMQRLLDFNQGELEDTDKLLTDFKQLKIAYLDKEPPQKDGQNPTYYSVLIDRDCEPMADGKRTPIYRIRLSGDPILGDGKGDNQNHAIIFYRGEYIQLVDANQDNYLEECLKIRSVLAEFEEITFPQDPYNPSIPVDSKSGGDIPHAPVAILGAREYVFSENIGVLGDVAAGKEQTFGTLFARTLAKIGGKLHYGHPDFLNGIFMTTRGGVSKAQKGLHLNEDIYAGMTAILRGGRIKHSEYIQCGKGRDLGFGSILNFTSKIGAGMGEQMLSREYYYLGTRLPLDRFLSFYYAHPGFHINNMFIVVSLELFLIVMLNLSALAGEAVICYHDPNTPKTDPHHPPGCQNLIPLFKWVERCVLSIFVVFFISFLPLFVQELTERGFWRSATRLGKHLLSLSPIFEVFVCQIYAHSLTYDLSLGGAKYISTGRGFATSRVPFATLYMRFASTSMYFGARSFIILLFISITSWKVSLLWFLVTTVALCLAPVIYNPHQFAMTSFFLDYREFVRWLFRGSTKYHGNSWISYVRENRARITGYKRKSLYEDSDSHKESSIPKLLNIIMSQVIVPLLVALSVGVPYLYVNSQNDIRAFKPYANPIARLGICTMGPILVDGLAVLIFFVIACCASPIFRLKYLYKIPSGIAAMAHIFSVVNHFTFFELMWLMERWNFRRALLGLMSSILLQTFLIKTVNALFLTRELKHSRTNSSWWTGRWASSELGWMIITQPLREYTCKVIEMNLFALDFTLGHCIFFVQTPILIIPYIDRWHSMMLFWLKPNKQKLSEKLVLPTTTVTLQHRLVRRYSIVYFMILLIFIASLMGPIFIPAEYKEMICDYVETYYPGIVVAKALR